MAISTYSVTWRLDVKNILDNLADFAGLTPTDGNFIVGDGANWVTESGDTALASLGGGATGIALFKDATAADARTELGLGTIATQAAANVAITGGAIDATAIGGSTPAAGSFTSLTATTGNLGNIAGLSIVSGDIIIANATPAFTRLPVGTNGQVLTVVSGAPAYADAASGLEFIATADLANDASADFTDFDATKYDAYLFVLMNVVPATDAVEFYMRTSADGGSSYDATGYSSAIFAWDSGASALTAGVTTAFELNGTNNIGSAANEYGLSGNVWINAPHLTEYTRVVWQGMFRTSSGAINGVNGSGARQSAAVVDAVQFLVSSGNLESGTITMYGLRNA